MDDPLPSNLNEQLTKLFATESTRTPGADFYQAVFDDPVIFPLQRPREMAKMIAKAREIRPRIVYEIGADKAGGLYHWCKCLPSVERVIACEIRGVPYGSLFQEAFPALDFLWMAESSYAKGTVDYVRNWLHGERIDVLFIDGDKSMFDVDFDVYLPLMNPNGIVFMHDINDRAPTEAYEKVIARGYRHEEILDIQDSIAAMERESDGIPTATSHEGWLRHWRGQSCGVGCIFLGERA